MTLHQKEPAQNNHSSALLSDTTESLHQLIGAAPVAIIAVDQGGDILYVNKKLEELFGYKRSELLNNKIEMLLPERLRTRHMQHRVDYMVTPYLRSMGSGMNLVGQRKHGEEFPLEAGLSTVLINDEQVVIASIVDITTRRQIEETLEQRVAAERSRIARDLHDSVTQTLFSATIIADVLPRLWARDVEQGKERLSELNRLNRRALAEMRTMLLELRPTMLDDADLNEVLQHLVDTTISRAHHPVTLQIEGNPEQLPNEVRIALYRITQEALNNVSKHAFATKAAVVLRVSPQVVSLSITDDGAGFDMEKIDGNREGLTIMTERADEIDARLEIVTTPGDGTKVSVLWHN